MATKKPAKSTQKKATTKKPASKTASTKRKASSQKKPSTTKKAPAKNKPTKEQIKKERSPKKVKKVLKEKGYPDGKLPKGKELHHVKPVAEGGKTTKKNTRVVTKKKHIQIHKNRRKKGKI